MEYGRQVDRCSDGAPSRRTSKGEGREAGKSVFRWENRGKHGYGAGSENKGPYGPAEQVPPYSDGKKELLKDFKQGCDKVRLVF